MVGALFRRQTAGSVEIDGMGAELNSRSGYRILLYYGMTMNCGLCRVQVRRHASKGAAGRDRTTAAEMDEATCKYLERRPRQGLARLRRSRVMSENERYKIERFVVEGMWSLFGRM